MSGQFCQQGTSAISLLSCKDLVLPSPWRSESQVWRQEGGNSCWGLCLSPGESDYSFCPLLKKKKKFYSFWLHRILAAACRMFICFSMWNLSCWQAGSSSLTRDQSQVPVFESRVLAIGSPGKSSLFSYYLLFQFSLTVDHSLH